MSVVKGADISECGRYRYELSRVWNDEEPALGFIMLNPSTADAMLDDPTIRRCAGFARDFGYGGIMVRNLFAFRATKPKNLPIDRAVAEGPRNYEVLLRCVEEPTVCAWGVHGGEAGEAVVERLIGAGANQLFHLGLTKAGYPRHPLYLPGRTQLTSW